MRRFLPLVLLLAVLITLGAPPRPASAERGAGSHVDVVDATYTILLDRFFRPVEPAALLTSGWDALGRAARRQGLPAPDALDDLPPDRDGALAAFDAAYGRYVAGLPDGTATESLAFAVAAGMASGLQERHTNFLPPVTYRRLLASLGADDRPVGAGLRTSPYRPWIVTELAPDGPAARAGVQAGDHILTVDGTDASSLSGGDLGRMLDGDDGSALTLSVERGGRQRDLALTRAPYYFPPLVSRMLPGSVGYLRVEHFVDAGAVLPDGSEFLTELDRRLDKLDGGGARALILDLRGNPGGSVTTASELLGRFLPEDTLTVVNADQRGHETTGIVSGMMRRTQLPMVALVDGRSASASEITAATLHDSGRALLVGQRTAGALASSQILPLPDGAGLQVAVSEMVTAATQTRIDGTGVPVDIEAADTRTSDDYRAGRDPQLDAAVAALDRAPAPPAFDSMPFGGSEAATHARLARFMPGPSAIPTNDRLTRVERVGERDLIHPNQIVDSLSRDPIALRQALRDRGWLGAHSEEFAAEVFGAPFVDVTVEQYATAAGAADALTADDAPELEQIVPPLLQLGDQTVAHRGIWRALGTADIAWRRGALVFTVTYFDVPGFERPETLAAIARLVDRIAAEQPSPTPAPAATLLGPRLVP